MRLAYHWDAYPSKGWFISAALLYDKVLIPKWTVNRRLYDVRLMSALTGAFPSVIHPQWEETNYLLDWQDCDFVMNAEEVINWEPLKALAPQDNESDSAAMFEIMREFQPHIDFFRRQSTSQTSSLAAVLPCIQVLVPANVSSINTQQVLEFRHLNELRRVKFQNAAENLVNQFGSADSYEDVERILRLIEQSLKEEAKDLSTIYKRCKIEAVAETIVAIGAPSAIFGVIKSMLGISCVEIDNLVATVSLSLIPYLVAKEKATESIEKSPWAYLWHVSRTFR